MAEVTAQTSFGFAFASTVQTLKSRGLTRRWRSGRDDLFARTVSLGRFSRLGHMHVDLYLLAGGEVWVDMWRADGRAKDALRLPSSASAQDVLGGIDAFFLDADWLGVPTVRNDPATRTHGLYQVVQGGSIQRPWGRST